MAKEDSILSGMRLLPVESDRNGPLTLGDDAERKTSTELVLYKGSDRDKQFPATWKEHWRARHDDPLWANYNKESYNIMPFPTLASGKSSSMKPGCHYKAQIRSRPDAFTCFPKLPTELRHQIWRHTLPSPRVVQILIDWHDPLPQPERRDYLRCRLIPKSAFGCHHLLACRESADVFREAYSQVTVGGVVSEGQGVFYKPGIRHFVEHGDFKLGPHSIGYVDFGQDTVVMYALDIELMDDIGVTLDISRAERLALIGRFFPFTLRKLPLWDSALQMCSSLKEFTLVRDWEDEFFQDLCERDCSALRLIPINLELNYVEFHDRFLPEGAFTNYIESSDKVRRITEERLKKNALRWENINFGIALLAQVCEEKCLVVEDVWLAPTAPEPYDVIYWMRAEYYEALPSNVYLPALSTRAIQDTNGELRNLYTGIAELFDE